MKNKQVIETFLKRKGNASTPLRIIRTDNGNYYKRTLTVIQVTDDNKHYILKNYDTIIAEIINDTLYINTHYYSKTTSVIQCMLYNKAQYYNYNIMVDHSKIIDKQINKTLKKTIETQIRELQNEYNDITSISQKVDILCKILRLQMILQAIPQAQATILQIIDIDKNNNIDICEKMNKVLNDIRL